MAKNNPVEDAVVKPAPKELLEELFQDYYANRYKLYLMNLVRGIFFGFGSVIGGTLFVALLVWVLSWFDELPFIGDFVESINRGISRGR